MIDNRHEAAAENSSPTPHINANTTGVPQIVGMSRPRTIDYRPNKGSHMSLRPRRSALYMPGSNARAIEKARTLPVEMLYFDNANDPARAVANAEAAIAQHVDLLIEYNADADANAAIARRLAESHVPAIALVHPLSDAPRYGPDNYAQALESGRVPAVGSTNGAARK